MGVVERREDKKQQRSMRKRLEENQTKQMSRNSGVREDEHRKASATKASSALPQLLAHPVS